MRSRFVRRWGSVLGMLAILMTAFAPGISQALASRDPAHSVFEWRCSPVENTSSSARHADAFNACGYCNFIAHFPFAPPAPASTSFAFTVQRARYPGHFEATAPFAAVVAAQPRAPPVAA